MSPGKASPIVTLTDSNGDVFTAHELKFTLNIVTPQNTVTSQEILDFKTSSSKYSELRIGFRPSIKVLRFSCVVWRVPVAARMRV
jgi:hypothetical protein